METFNSRDIDNTFELYEWDELERMVNKTINEIIDLFQDWKITKDDAEWLLMYLNNKARRYAN